jgi:hypothetical protein
MHVNVWIKRAALAALACVFVGCGGGGGGGNGSGSNTLYVIYHDGNDTRLATIEKNDPTNFDDIGGLGTGASELVTGLDIRPQDNELYAYNQDFNELLILNKATGAASLVGGNSATILGDVSIDFDPVNNNIRLITTFEDNVRLNSTTGAVAGTDTDLSPAGTITDIAFTNNSSSANSTTLYGIDAEFNELVRIGGLNGSPSPGTGAVSIVGALGISTIGEFSYFDIDPDGRAWMVESFDAGGGVFTNRLYEVNLTTGTAILVGTIALTDPIVGLAAE